MMEIDKMATLSTKLIQRETERKLSEECYTNNMRLSVYEKEGYGFFIFIPDEEQFQSNHEIPEDLKNCMRVASDNGCKWLCLDCDGPEHEDLMEYEW